jgi:CheY-like chemotaxis protein
MDNQLWHADTDPHQLENALLNLAINARDAMMDSGSLTFEAFNLHYEQSSEDLPPGDYVVLSLRDNGPGMDDETRMRVLEPFFTTKPAGQGTGLGLSMVYGFVRQNGGQLIIDTAPGQGTSISLILPRAHQITDQVEAKVAVDVADSLQDLNVLLVEDDKGMQSVLNTVLQDEGCSVEALSDGPAAEEWLRQAPGTPDVLLTDLVLPGGTNGLDLARKLEAVAPDCAIIFMSGYLDDELKDWRDELHDSFFLNKPFSRQELRDTVTSALSGKQA